MIQADIEDRTIRLGTPYAMKDRCAAIPGGMWSPKTRTWNYPLTPATANSIFGLFHNDLPQDVCETLGLARNAFAVGPTIKEMGPTQVPDIPKYKTAPWHHQKVAYHFASSILFNEADIGGGVLLGLDMGCGKTYCAISVIANHLDKLNKILIGCPHSVVDVWANEIRKHSDIDAVILTLAGNDSVAKKQSRAKQGLYLATIQEKPLIVIVNYESMWREPLASWILDEAKFDLSIMDEIHRIKAPGGKTSKFCQKLGKSVKYRLGLSGTPLPHCPLDAYGQYRFLDPGIFGTSFTRFRSDFAVMGGFQGHQVLNYKNLDDLSARMYSIGYRVMSKDVFDLPPFQDVVRTFDLQPEDRDMYRSMDQEFCVQVKDGMVTADNALVKILRLQEMTSGFLEGEPVNIGKKKLLVDIMEDFEQKEPIVVFARFTNDLKNIKDVAELQGRSYAELSGHVNELSKWQNGEADVLGVQIKSGKEGVDFTRARYCIYYSIGHSLGDYNQSRKRVDRPGQTREGVYIHLIAKNTIDEVIMKSLERQEEIVESVLAQYKERKL